MPWQTPGLADLRKINRDNVVAGLGSSSLLPNSVARILSDANAGLAHLVLQYVDYLAKQMLPDTAEGDWLRDRHAMIWLGGWKQPTFAEVSVKFTGVPNSIVPLGSRFNLSIDGDTIEYVVTQTVYLDPAGNGVTNARALVAGSAANVDPGTSADLSVALNGVNGVATIVSVEGGIDGETDDELRARVLQRIRNPPLGGSAEDYVRWMLSVPGVTRAWCSPLELGLGTVTLRFMMDNLRAEDDGIPTASDKVAMFEYIDSVRPVTVKDLFIEAPIPYPINFTIQNLYPDTDSVKTAIAASVKAMLHDKAAPAYARNGISQDAQKIYAAWISEAIYHADGVERFTLVVNDIEMPNAGSLAVLGTITYA